MINRTDLENFSSEDLEEIIDTIKSILAQRQNSDQIAFLYGTLRDRFFKIYGAARAGSFRFWKELTKEQKEYFKDRWYRARDKLIKLGFEDNENLTAVIFILLTTNNPYFINGLTLKGLTSSLTHIDELFDQSYPDYRYSGISLIK